MEPLNKKEIGKRIKQLRKDKGLKQWQMADILGATQPAIHKYENGILPEVKRLLELARVGNTTVEWILTGQHWENGAVERERFPLEIYRLAERFHLLTRDELRILTSALDMLEKTAHRIRERTGQDLPEADIHEMARALREFDGITRRTIQAALAVHAAVLESLAQTQIRQFESLSGDREAAAEPEDARAVPRPLPGETG
jgi:transcriptional regulator with XRE-family HTH domain